MTASEAMKAIESLEFSAAVNVASTYKTFLRVMGNQPAVRVLANEMANRQVVYAVLRRILQLCHVPREPGLEHPADSALAAYLWLLSTRAPFLGSVAANLVLSSEGCWWARKMAKGLVESALTEARSTVIKNISWNEAKFTKPDYSVAGESEVQKRPFIMQCTQCGAPEAADNLEILFPSNENRITDYFRNSDSRTYTNRLEQGVMV
ncbi:MAG: hypothetical protein U0793_14770 [Gemmataceae bacterium]